MLTIIYKWDCSNEEQTKTKYIERYWWHIVHSYIIDRNKIKAKGMDNALGGTM